MNDKASEKSNAGSKPKAPSTAAESAMSLLTKLRDTHALSTAEYLTVLQHYVAEDAQGQLFCMAQELAEKQRLQYYGNKVYIRGLIEIGNICRNNCLYCGIRADNRHAERYRLSSDEILHCCEQGYALGFRTFVLQGGEDRYFSDEVLTQLIYRIKSDYADCAVTLSLGERSFQSYRALKAAGADRYLLRHETITPEHYQMLHPEKLKLQHRINCLNELKRLGFQTGCGMMVGSPYQKLENLAADLKFIEQFQPEMCGIGPFIPHHDTPFANFPAGSPLLTCFLLAIIRLIKPNILLPATTALNTLGSNYRELGIRCGANVVMPNLSPLNVRSKYMLYDHKATSGSEAAEELNKLRALVGHIGYEIVTARGDVMPLK